MPTNPVQVCPIKDIECGSNAKNWCAKCPKRETHRSAPVSGCPRCGIAGLHACPGAVLRAPSEAEKQELARVLAEYAPKQGLPFMENFRFVEDPLLPDGVVVFKHPTGVVDDVPKYGQMKIDPVQAEAAQRVFLGTPVSIKDGVLTKAHIDQAIHKLHFPDPVKPFAPTHARAIAFINIKALINGEDQDGVLAKIRQIVNACP